MKEISQWFKNCPRCNGVLYYKNKAGLDRSIKNNTNCYICVSKNRIFSNITKQKLREIAIKQFENGMPEETKRKISENHNGMDGKYHSEESKKKISEAIRKCWNNSTCKYNSLKRKPKSAETRQKISEFHKGKPLSEETKNKISKTLKGRIFSEETKKKMSNAALKYMQSFNYKNRYKLKTFVFSNGRDEKIQGYEPWTLDLLLKEGIKDDDIKIIDRPVISYYYNYYRNYCPDCYIKSTNTIVETKSNWTFQQHIELNKAKWNATVDGGYNLRILIWDRQHNLIKDEMYSKDKK